jgi:NADH-quinone oxidoreductase subunit L
MPTTFRTFWLAGLALAGFPLLAGFWSKDEIIHAALHSQMPWLGWIALATALLTAFYTFRMINIAFRGPVKLPAGVHEAHENGKWMLVPLIALAFGAIFAGYVGVSFHGGGFLGIFEPGGWFHAFLAPVLSDTAAGHGSHAHAEGGGHALMYWSSLISIAGIVAAGYVYRRRPLIAAAAAFAAGPVYRLVSNKYYVDELYDAVIVRPLRRFGEFCYGVDRYFIDGVLFAIRAVPQTVGYLLKGSQSGAMQGYATGMVVGLLAIVLWMLVSA